MSSQSTRLIASSDKYWLQQIANNTAVDSDSNIQKLTPVINQDSLQAVGVYGSNTSNKWQSLSIDANGKLETTAVVSASGSGLATEAKQDTGNTSLATIAGDTTSLDTKVVACNTGAVVVSSTALATGASTSALQTTGNTSLASIDNKVILPSVLSNGNLKVSIQEGATPAITGFSTSALQTTGNTSLATIATETTSMNSKITTCDTGAVVVSSSVLPTNASTSALQTTGNTSLASIDNKVILPSVLSNGNLKVSIQEGATPAITGFSTSANQDTMITDLGIIKGDTTSIDGKITACNTGDVVVSSSALPTNASTSAKQDTMITDLGIIKGDTTSIDGKITACNTGAVVVSSSVLPTNASTSALQSTGNTSLASIDNKVILPSALSNGNLKVSIQEGATPAITGFATSALQTTGNTSLATLNAKVSKGEDTSIASGAGGLQQVLCYGMDNQNNLEPVNIDPSGHLKITINDVDETNTGLKVAGETVGGSQVNLRTETNGSLNVALTSGQITGFSTSALQAPANASLTSIDSTLTDGIQIKGKFGASSVDLQANSNSQLFVDVVGSSGNGGDDLYTNATISSANTASSDISILEDRVISIMGSTTTSTAKIGIAFVDHNSNYWASPEYADLYYDGTKYTFCLTVSNVLTDNVKVYFQTPANNVNVSYFTY